MSVVPWWQYHTKTYQKKIGQLGTTVIMISIYLGVIYSGKYACCVYIHNEQAQ